MRKIAIALAAAALLAGTAAHAEEGGAAAGAVTGGVTGAIVGGPVGAVVGAGVGAVAGDAVTDRPRDRVYIQRDPDTTGSVNCRTTTTRTENGMGDSTTVRRQSCN